MSDMAAVPSGVTTDPSSDSRAIGTRPVPLTAFQVALYLFLLADAFSKEKFGLPLPVSPDRVFLALFLVLLLVDPRVRWRTWRVKSAAWVGLATLGWAASSAFVHGTLRTSLGAFALLDRLAVPYILFALAPLVLPSQRSRVVLLQVLTVLGLYLGVTAFFEVIGPQSLVFPSYIASPSFGITYGRARGPLGASDADAAVMGTCLFLALALARVTPSPRWRITSVLSAIACLIGVLLSLTRAEWVGTGAAIVVSGLVVPSWRRKMPAAILAIALAIAAALIASPALRSDVTDRASTSRSVYDRENTNAAGFRALDTDPLVGIGWMEFLEQSERYVRQAPNYPITHVDIEIHNVPLSRLTELGLLGGGLWILSVLLGPVAAMFVRRRRDKVDDAYRVAFIGGAIVWLVAIQFSPFPYPLPNALVWLLAGVVLTPLNSGADVPSRGARRTNVGRSQGGDDEYIGTS